MVCQSHRNLKVVCLCILALTGCQRALPANSAGADPPQKNLPADRRRDPPTAPAQSTAIEEASPPNPDDQSMPAPDPLIGTPAPDWTASHWLNSRPLRLEDLRGRLVLVRWWTAPGCRYCKSTAPALDEFHDRFADRGLTVIGLYHHKSAEPLDPEQVRRHADEFGFEFPVAIDDDWATLRRWWLDDGPRIFTSVSFLIDRQGIVRHIHPGGQYVKGDDEYAAMEGQIEQWLDD